MGLFKRKAESHIQITPTHSSRVEIQVAKDANKEVKEKAKQINSDVKNLLVQNGFTLTIALAAHSPRSPKRKDINTQ